MTQSSIHAPGFTFSFLSCSYFLSQGRSAQTAQASIALTPLTPLLHGSAKVQECSAYLCAHASDMAHICEHDAD